MLNFDSNDRDRVTIAAIFVASYVALALGLIDRVNMNQFGTHIVNDLVSTMFVILGSVNATLFFLYIVFSALGLNYNRDVIEILGQRLSDNKVLKIKKWLFDQGVRGVLTSFLYPVFYFFRLLSNVSNFWLALVTYIVCIMLIWILARIILKD